MTEPDPRAQMEHVAAVRFERLLPGPIERVWAHLADARLLPEWFGADGSIEPRQGGAVSLMGGHIRGTITQWNPPVRLSYTWNVFDPGASAEAVSPYPESYLSITLEAQGEKVRLVLSHVPVLERFEKQNAMGWHTFLDLLAAKVVGGVVEERGVYMRKNAELYGVDLSKLAT